MVYEIEYSQMNLLMSNKTIHHQDKFIDKKICQTKSLQKRIHSKKPHFDRTQILPDKKGTDKQKTVILLKNVNQATKRNTKKEIEKEDKPTKYTYKSYAGLLVVIVIFLIFVGFKFYSFFTNFFFSTINLACSFSGYVVKLPCSQKFRTLYS